jgi:tetratricopeptide (TPR) repeat protein
MLSSLSPAVSAQGLDIAKLLDQYAAGDYGAAQVSGGGDPDRFVQALERQATRWISAGEDVPSRRFIAAAFALEAAESLLQSPRRILYRRLFEWARLQARPLTPSDRLTAWHLAAASLLMRAEDWPVLAGSGEATSGHLAHARAAAPDEPRFRLAAAVAAESRAVTSRKTPLPGKIADPLLERLASQYAELASIPRIAAEARLRHGVTMIRLGKTDAALADFADVEKMTTDSHVRHVAAFLSGVIHERAGRPGEALRHLRRALEIVPGAASATAMAAALLMVDGKADEAAVLTEAVFAGPAAVVDPWRLYPSGDGRLWSAHIAQLRRVLR